MLGPEKPTCLTTTCTFQGKTPAHISRGREQSKQDLTNHNVAIYMKYQEVYEVPVIKKTSYQQSIKIKFAKQYLATQDKNDNVFCIDFSSMVVL